MCSVINFQHKIFFITEIHYKLADIEGKNVIGKLISIFVKFGEKEDIDCNLYFHYYSDFTF